MGKLNSSTCNWMDVGKVVLFKGNSLYFRSTSPICFFCIRTNCTINRIVVEWSKRREFSLTLFLQWCTFLVKATGEHIFGRHCCYYHRYMIAFSVTEHISLRQVSGKKVIHLTKSSVSKVDVRRSFFGLTIFWINTKISNNNC